MIGLAVVGVGTLCIYFGGLLWRQYQQQQLIPLSLGLLGLGLVNIISGLIFAVGGLGVGFVAVAAGAISLNLGQWLNETAYEKPTHPDILAGRGAASFFVIGVVFLLEMGY